ncbi:MAG TPA: hypothetical protein VF598_04910 [Hymenobacter sp.]
MRTASTRKPAACAAWLANGPWVASIVPERLQLLSRLLACPRQSHGSPYSPPVRTDCVSVALVEGSRSRPAALAHLTPQAHQ